LPEYPRPQLRRETWLNLNGIWQLDFAAADEAPPFGKTLSQRILVPFPVESALSGVMKHADRLWYRRTFRVPAAWRKQRTLLHFGAVDWEAKVYVNRKPVGNHRGGYDPFTFDITDALTDEGDQELVVGVFDPTSDGTQPRGKQVKKPGGIYYTPITGIWQTVWLEPVPADHIERLKIVPDVDAGKVRITVVTAGNTAGQAVAVAARGNKADYKVTGKPGEAIELKLADPQLWSPESPFLYDLDVRLVQGGKEVDAVQSYFGFRKVEVGKPDPKGPPRILLNGKPIFQVGLLDQGYWPDGLYTAPTDEALKYDIEISKKLGFNLARKHVKVEPARWYYWCDRLGLLVWQDMPSGDRSVAPDKPDLVRTKESAEQFERELERMMDSLHNHPCIITWVVFNEGWGQYDTNRMADLAKKRDPTRLIDSASGWNDRSGGDVHDIHRYPNPGAPPADGKRAGVLGEFGGLGLGVDGHTWAKKTWGYQGMRSQSELTRKYERLLDSAWKLRDEQGLCAVVYTQLTDVETEANGLLTYDRAVIKVDIERVAAVNRGDRSRIPHPVVLVPDSRTKGQVWRYTTEKPAGDWFSPEFKEEGWSKGEGGFGTKGTPGAVVRTEWKTADIWIRRNFDLAAEPRGDLYLSLHHDEDAEIYINGVLAGKVSGFITDYEEIPLSPAARKALRAGKNVLAVHCHQTTGGQYIDVGLVTLGETK
jgi:hypothetical protein